MTMETTNKNLERLLELLENPIVEHEGELTRLLSEDEECREYYALMVKSRQAIKAHELQEKELDIDAAWQQFNSKQTKSDKLISFRKIAAAIIALLMLSGISYAAIHIVKQMAKQEIAAPERDSESPNQRAGIGNPSHQAMPVDTLKSDTIPSEPRVFNNVELDVMLSEIAATHHVEVEFQNENARQLRFHFVWKREDNLEQIVEKLNNFESVSIVVEDKKLVVR